MLNTLSVIERKDLNNDYYQIEHCGIYDSCVSDYYIVLAKSNFRRFCDLLGAETDSERKDILNKINVNQIRSMVLVELDTVHESITGYLCDIYDDEDGMLEHYGLLEVQEPPLFMDDSFAEDSFAEDSFAEEPIPQPEYQEPVNQPEYKEPVVQKQPVTMQHPVYGEPKKDEAQIVMHNTIQEDKPKVIEPEPPIQEEPQIIDTIVDTQEETVENIQEDSGVNLQENTDENYNNMMVEPKDKAVYDKALAILADKLGVDFNLLMEQAEQEVEAENNPYFTEEEVELAVELLSLHGKISAFEGEFLTKMYKDGKIAEITELLNIKLGTIGGNY